MCDKKSIHRSQKGGGGVRVAPQTFWWQCAVSFAMPYLITDQVIQISIYTVPKGRVFKAF